MNLQNGLAWFGEPFLLARSPKSSGQRPCDLTGGQEQHCQHHPEQCAGGGDRLCPGEDQDGGSQEEHGPPRVYLGN